MKTNRIESTILKTKNYTTKNMIAEKSSLVSYRARLSNQVSSPTRLGSQVKSSDGNNSFTGKFEMKEPSIFDNNSIRTGLNSHITNNTSQPIFLSNSNRAWLLKQTIANRYKYGKSKGK